GELAQLRCERADARDVVRDGRDQLEALLPERDGRRLVVAAERRETDVDRPVVLLRHVAPPYAGWPRRFATASRTYAVISSSDAPGWKMRSTPCLRSPTMSSSGMIPPPNRSTSSMP